MRKKKGTRNNAKLTPSIVKEIRDRNEWKKAKIKELNEKYSIKGMANDLGVSRATVSKALSRITWGSVL